MMNTENTETSLGSRLKQIRVANNLSVFEIARYLHLREEIIEKMEADEGEQLLTDVFYRGYFRSYAKVLHFPEMELQRYLDKHQNTPPPAQDKKKNANVSSGHKFKGRNKSHDKWLILATILIFIIIFGLTGRFWWQEHRINEDQLAKLVEQIEERQSQESPVINAPVVLNENDIESNQDKPNELNENNVETDAIESPSTAQTDVAANETKKVQSAHVLPLTIEFTGDCWLKIFNADSGALLFQGLKKAGDSLKFDEKIVYGLHIGNISAANVTLNGENVNIARYSKNRSTARFTLNAKED